MAAKLELHTDTRRKKSIRLATGELVYSPGTVDVKWRFDGESEDVDMRCWVLPKCIHDVILGKGFLEMTSTLTKFKNRIRSKFSAASRRLRLRFVDGELSKSQHLRGYLNGQSTLAMADTGSDAMFVSSSYAMRRGFDIDKNPSIQYEVEFANGSTQWSTGVVHGATWTLGGQTTRCDLLVLDGLSEDLILNKDYLLEEDVYTAHRDLFTDYQLEEDDFYDLLNIRLLGRYKRSLDDVEQGYLDESLEDDFGSDMLDKELARRDTISDHIAALPPWQREAAYQAEAERQRLWQIEREARGMRAVHAPPAVQPPNPQDRAPALGKVSARRLKLLQGVLATSSAKSRLLKAKNGIEAVRTSVVTRAASWRSKDEDAAVIPWHNEQG